MYPRPRNAGGPQEAFGSQPAAADDWPRIQGQSATWWSYGAGSGWDATGVMRGTPEVPASASPM